MGMSSSFMGKNGILLLLFCLPRRNNARAAQSKITAYGPCSLAPKWYIYVMNKAWNVPPRRGKRWRRREAERVKVIKGETSEERAECEDKKNDLSYVTLGSSRSTMGFECKNRSECPGCWAEFLTIFIFVMHSRRTGASRLNVWALKEIFYCNSNVVEKKFSIHACLIEINMINNVGGTNVELVILVSYETISHQLCSTYCAYYLCQFTSKSTRRIQWYSLLKLLRVLLIFVHPLQWPHSIEKRLKSPTHRKLGI